MGSRSTKVATPPHVEAAASPVAPAQQHHEKSNCTNETGLCQESVHQAAQAISALTQPLDDINLEYFTPETTTSRRRYSEPARTAAMATEVNIEGIRHIDAFESLVAERSLMAIDIDYPTSYTPLPPIQTPISPSLTVHQTAIDESEEPEESEVQCIACCTQLPKEKDPAYAREAIKYASALLRTNPSSPR